MYTANPQEVFFTGTSINLAIQGPVVKAYLKVQLEIDSAPMSHTVLCGLQSLALAQHQRIEAPQTSGCEVPAASSRRQRGGSSIAPSSVSACARSSQT